MLTHFLGSISGGHGSGAGRRFGRVALAATACWSALCSRRSHPAAASSQRPPLPVEAEKLLAHLKVVPYGVLGSSSAGKVAPEPDSGTAFVDPAGLHHIRGGPGGAGGAAGVIYKWLGISGAPSFPEPVTLSITRPLQARYHAYGANKEKKCIHVVGPDFRQGSYTFDQAVTELSEAYFMVFREFRTSDLHRLRLLPVSGGIFSGPFSGDLPELTVRALAAAFARLDLEAQAYLLRADVELCIFMEKQVAEFEQAFTSALPPPGSCGTASQI